MTATLILARAFAKLLRIELTRYAFDTVSSLIAMYLLFLVVFFGIQGIGDVTEGKTLSSIVLGFNVWVLLMFAYSSVAAGLVGEAQTGTLEQLAMSPLGLLNTFLVRFWVGFLYVFVQITFLLNLAMLTTGHWLHMDVVSVVPLLLITGAAILGIGLIMGGLALVFKKVANVSGLLQFGLIALVAAPVDQFPALKWVPVSLGYQLLNRVMVDEVPISAIPVGDVVRLIVGAAVFFLAGVAVFKAMEGQARDRGLLGQY
jgi:ABC-2 type transport system permease protein